MALSQVLLFVPVVRESTAKGQTETQKHAVIKATGHQRGELYTFRHLYRDPTTEPQPSSEALVAVPSLP